MPNILPPPGQDLLFSKQNHKMVPVTKVFKDSDKNIRDKGLMSCTSIKRLYHDSFHLLFGNKRPT